MAATLALLVYLPALAVGLVAVWRRPVLALYAFAVGLAFHNLAMALLYGAGVTGFPLDVIQAWKELLLAAALGRVAVDAVRARALPFRPGLVDLLALAFGGLVVLYALIPQDALDGEAGANAILLSARHALAPVAAYLLGRSLVLGGAELRRLAWTILGTAAAVAAIGLVEEYTVSVETWRDAGVPAYFRDELGFEYRGPARMPENFAFNSGGGELHRRLVGTFVSPLASAFLFAVALLLTAAGGFLRSRLGAALAAVTFVGLLFTISRSAVLALAGGLVVLAAIQRRAWPVAAAAGVVAAGLLFTATFQDLAPETHFLPVELAEQARIAREQGDVEGGAVSLNEPSIRSHLESLRAGLETVAEHPFGYGLGNAGAVARRRGRRPQGRRVELHRDRRRDRRARPRRVPRVERRAVPRACARRSARLGRGRGCGLARDRPRARPPDRRVRRPVARLCRLGPRRRPCRHRRRTRPAGLAGARRPDCPATVRATDGEVSSGEI